MIDRLRLTWQVYRHGLPDIEVRHETRNVTADLVLIRTELDYPGKVWAEIDGAISTALNGTFAVEQYVRGEGAP